MRLHADLIEVSPTAEPRRLGGFHQDQGNGLGAGIAVGLGGNADQVGGLPIGDEYLGAIEAIIITVADGGSADVAQVRAGAGFGHGERGDHFAARQLGQPACLLKWRAMIEKVGDDDVMNAQAPAQIAGARLFEEDDHIVRRRAAGTAQLRGYRRADQAEFAGLDP